MPVSSEEQEQPYYNSTDPFLQGLAIFDMTTLQSSEQYIAGVKSYEQSDPIKQFYAQSQKYVNRMKPSGFIRGAKAMALYQLPKQSHRRTCDVYAA